MSFHSSCDLIPNVLIYCKTQVKIGSRTAGVVSMTSVTWMRMGTNDTLTIVRMELLHELGRHVGHACGEVAIEACP